MQVFGSETFFTANMSSASSSHIVLSAIAVIISMMMYMCLWLTDMYKLYAFIYSVIHQFWYHNQMKIMTLTFSVIVLQCRSVKCSEASGMYLFRYTYYPTECSIWNLISKKVFPQIFVIKSIANLYYKLQQLHIQFEKSHNRSGIYSFMVH